MGIKKCLKSLISMIIALTMLMPTALPVFADNSASADNIYGFVDFPTGWSKPAMAHAVENGLIYGKTSDRIYPQDNLTRAEMATIIDRAFGATVTKDISAFADVSESQWYYNDIKKAYNMQTLYGDAGGTMRPDAFIIREEAIAIVARAMVLSGYSASNLDRFKDKADIADWAVDPLASMAANGYVNGDENSNMNPKAFITREEFAQLLYNIIKHYYNPENKAESYQGNLMLNKPDISLEKITVNGDLVLGDGVGTSVITLTDVKITGRLLVRGAAQITLKNVTADKGVAVKNVNGTVHFDNYREEKIFDGVIEHTTVTYKQKAAGGGGGGGTPPAPTSDNYTVEHYQETLDGSFAVFETEILSGTIGESVTAVAKTYTGFSEDTTNPQRYATGAVASGGTLVLKLYYIRNSYTVHFNFGSGAVVDPSVDTSKTDKYGATVVLPTTGFSNDTLNFAGWYTQPDGAGEQITQVVIGAGDTTVYVYWTTQNTYKVEHYQENIDGTYSVVAADTQILTADANDVVTAVAKTYTGFFENTSHPQRVPNGTVLADNSLVLKLYYQRNTYTFTFDAQGGSVSGTPKTVYKYGETLDLPVATKGTNTFAGWYTGEGGTGTKITNLSVLGTDITTATITLYAHWTSGTPKFVVEHYQEALDGGFVIFETDPEQSISIGTILKAQDYKKDYPGFTVDLTNSPDVTVTAGNNTLQIYYTRNSYNVTYNYGEAGGQDTVSLKYEASISLAAPTVTVAGKYFAGWYDASTGGTQITSLTVPVGGTTIYAHWTPALVAYKVEHYKQNIENDGYSATPEITPGSALTDSTVSGKSANFAGFTVDLTVAGTVNSAIVAADGTTTLKYFYKRNTYGVTYNFNNGTTPDTHTVALKYEAGVDLAFEPTPDKAPENKYFAGWYTAKEGGMQIKTLTVPVGGGEIFAHWNDNPPYAFEYHKENADNAGYTVIRTVYNDRSIGDLVEIPEQTYEGFTEDTTNANRKLKGNVAVDTTLVLRRYYTRDRYNVTFETGAGTPADGVIYKYGQTVTLPETTRQYYKVEGWYTQAGGKGTKVESGAVVGETAGLTDADKNITLYAYWVLDWDGKVKFVANVENDKGEFPELGENEFYITVSVPELTEDNKFNNPVGIAKYELTLSYDNSNVKALLDNGKVVTDLKGFGNGTAPIETAANDVSSADEAAALNSITVTWDNSVANGGDGQNKTGGADLFRIKFEITNVKGDEDHEQPSVYMLRRMLRSLSISVVEGLSSLPFTLEAESVEIIADDGETSIPLDKEAEGDSLEPYKVEHYKENAEDDKYSLAYTEYGHAVLDSVVHAEYRQDYSNAGFRPDYVNSIDKAQIVAGGAILKLYYLRQRYTVTLDYQGATTESFDSISLKYGALVMPHLPDESNFEKTDWNFAGWYTEPNGAGEFVDAGYTVPVDGVTLYAHWTQTPYRVEHYFENADGTDFVINDSYTEEKQAKAGTLVTAVPKTDILGFEYDASNTLNVISETLAEGSTPDEIVTVLKVYYTRKTYTIDYKFGDGYADGSYETTFKYGQSITLANAANTDGTILEGWYTEADGKGTKIGAGGANVDIASLVTLEDDSITLYANWVEDIGEYSIEFYQQDLDGSDYTIVATDTQTGLTGTIGKIVSVDATADQIKNKYVGFTVNITASELSKTLAKTGTVLRVYFDRNEYTLIYDYSEADKTGIPSQTFKYGQTITFPLENTFEKSGYKFAGWYTTTNFNDDELLDTSFAIEDVVNVANGDTEATIYAKWSEVFTVTFREGTKIGTYTVDPEVSSTVPYSAFPYDKLKERYKKGYFKDASVSSVYEGNEYQHQFEGDWYYTDDNGENVLFTDETVVDRDLTVRYKFRYVRLELFAEKLSHNLVLEVPFEESTRVIDSIKDELFVNQEKILLLADEINAREKFLALNLKLVDFLADKGLEITPGQVFADDGEILKQHIKFNAFAYMDEASLKTVVVNAIRTTFKNDPLRMRGVIDEMMTEQDSDVVDLMDTMLVSMLSGVDAERIKGIIADAVETAIAEDTTGEFKAQIKSIITSRLNQEAAPEFAGEKVVTTSVKKAINDYFMNSTNDAKIKEIVSDLIDDAYATDDDTDPVRAFVKSYITTYLNEPENHEILDSMIREMGENLDKNNPDDAPIIELIHDVLDENVAYLEKLVDEAIANLKNYNEDDPIYIFIVDAVKEELSNNPDELEVLINEIANTNVADLKPVLTTVMEDKDIFDTIVTSAIDNETVFKKVIETALGNTAVFETIVRELCSTETAFYDMLINIALSSDTLTNEVKDAVINDDEALIAVLKEISSDAVLREEMVEEILAAGDSEIKAHLTNPIPTTSQYYDEVKAQALAQAEAEIVNIIETGINETDHPEYWPIAYEKAMDVAKGKITQDLIDASVDPNGPLWDSLYAEALAQAEIDVKEQLNTGITIDSDYYAVAVNGAKTQAEAEITSLMETGLTEGGEYWDIAYAAAKAIAKDEIDVNLNTEIDNIKTDNDLKTQVKAWASTAIDKPQVETAIKNLVKDLGSSTASEDVVLKNSIIDTVINTVKDMAQLEKDGLVDDIITELLKTDNALVKATVADKAIDILNNDTTGLKEALVEDVIDDVFADSNLKDELVNQLITKVKDPAQADFKDTVVNEAIKAVVDDDKVNKRAVVIVNRLIEDISKPEFKENIIEHIVDYILGNATVRAEAMEKVIEMVEDPDDTSHKQEVIEFAFNVLGNNETQRDQIAEKLLTSILSDQTKREDMATEVIDIMFRNTALRDRILDVGFQQMFSSAETIEEVVSLALDELIKDDVVRRDMIIAVISTESGRRSILDILFDELERDPTFIDDMIDIAMKGKYGDLVDDFVYQVINEGRFEINPDNVQIADEIVLPMLDSFTLDTVLERLPERITDILPTSKIEEIFNKFKSKARELLVEAIEEGKQGNSKYINIMIDHDIDVINDILVPAYNKVFPKVVDKAEDFYYYNENVHLKAIVDMIDPTVLLDNSQPASSGGTGYRLRTADEYYVMLRNVFVLADDAADWYLNNISDEQIDSAINKIADKLNTYLGKLNSFVGNRIPVSKVNTVVDYTKKILDKRERIYNVSTEGLFQHSDEVYDKFISFVEEKTGVDITKSTIIEVTFDGSRLSVNDKDVNIDNYDISISVKGYTFKLDSHSITVQGKTVDISRFVQKAADIFGTRTVTVKVTQDTPYSYAAYVGNNYIKLSAEYK